MAGDGEEINQPSNYMEGWGANLATGDIGTDIVSKYNKGERKKNKRRRIGYNLGST